MRGILFFGILISLFVAIEFISFRSLIRVVPATWKLLSTLLYWITTGLAYGVIFYSIWKYPEFQLRRDFSVPFFAFGISLLLIIPKIIIVLTYGIDYVVLKTVVPAEFREDRRRFIASVGWVLASIPFLSIFWGMWKGKYSYRVDRVSIPLDPLSSEQPIRIVQLSDAHLGSFPKDAPIAKALKRVNDLKPDIIVFTGDLVNSYAEEAEKWVDEFRELHAPYGKFSVLGNHDYGDYGRFESEEEKKTNHDRLIDIHKEMGFDLLLNENRKISIGDRSIQLIGLENWGLPPFPQYGDLNKAKAGLEDGIPNVLLSHDPSHWDAQVLGQENIALALAGHTHGMQFGLRIGGWQWSPVKYKYPRWAGHYQIGNQHLYVNRGFGYLGFPGRVGMPPEITYLEV